MPLCNILSLKIVYLGERPEDIYQVHSMYKGNQYYKTKSISYIMLEYQKLLKKNRKSNKNLE